MQSDVVLQDGHGHPAGCVDVCAPFAQAGQLQLKEWTPTHAGQLHDEHCGQAHPAAWLADLMGIKLSVVTLVELSTLLVTNVVFGTVNADTDT